MKCFFSTFFKNSIPHKHGTQAIFYFTGHFIMIDIFSAVLVLLTLRKHVDFLLEEEKVGLMGPILLDGVLYYFYLNTHMMYYTFRHSQKLLLHLQEMCLNRTFFSYWIDQNRPCALHIMIEWTKSIRIKRSLTFHGPLELLHRIQTHHNVYSFVLWRYTKNGCFRRCTRLAWCEHRILVWSFFFLVDTKTEYFPYRKKWLWLGRQLNVISGCVSVRTRQNGL